MERILCFLTCKPPNFLPLSLISYEFLETKETKKMKKKIEKKMVTKKLKNCFSKTKMVQMESSKTNTTLKIKANPIKFLKKTQSLALTCSFKMNLTKVYRFIP